jgi:hypothetical protein
VGCGERVDVYVRAPVDASEDLRPEVPDVIWKDYQATLSFIDKLDGQLFSIRNLTIVSGSSVIAFAISKDKPSVLLANLIVVPAFLLLELAYKCFHEDGIVRSVYLERAIEVARLTGDVPPDYRFGIGQSIRPPSPRRLLELLVHSKRWHIRIVHLLLLLVSAAAYYFLI